MLGNAVTFLLLEVQAPLAHLVHPNARFDLRIGVRRSACGRYATPSIEAYLIYSKRSVPCHDGSLLPNLATLCEVERAKEWTERALLLDPDNLNLRYNCASVFVVDLREFDAALDLLEPALKTVGAEAVAWYKTDPDLDLIRDHPRFKAAFVRQQPN